MRINTCIALLLIVISMASMDLYAQATCQSKYTTDFEMLILSEKHANEPLLKGDMAEDILLLNQYYRALNTIVSQRNPVLDAKKAIKHQDIYFFYVAMDEINFFHKIDKTRALATKAFSTVRSRHQFVAKQLQGTALIELQTRKPIIVRGGIYEVAKAFHKTALWYRYYWNRTMSHFVKQHCLK